MRATVFMVLVVVTGSLAEYNLEQKVARPCIKGHWCQITNEQAIERVVEIAVDRYGLPSIMIPESNHVVELWKLKKQSLSLYFILCRRQDRTGGDTPSNVWCVTGLQKTGRGGYRPAGRQCSSFGDAEEVARKRLISIMRFLARI